MSDDEGDDDWFERAVDEDQEVADAADQSTGDSGGNGDGAPAVDETEREEAETEGAENKGGVDEGGVDEASGSGATDTEEPELATDDVSIDESAGVIETPEGTDSPFGAGGGGEDLFEDDFASAFGGGGDDTTFDDEDLDSDIPRVDLGIEGLDDMIQGGIPERHLLTTIGSAGTGKTTFGLQFLHHGLTQGERGVFITLEQSHEAILDTAGEWGWDFEGYESTDELAVVDLDPVEMANSLDNIRGELPELIEDFGADRLVLDSVSLLEMMYDDPARRRTEVYDFTRSLKNAGVTTFLTSEASETNPYASRHGIIEYLTDAVFVLQYVRAESRETRLAVEIMKIRNANHSRATKPYELTSDGISVYQQANIF